MWLRTFIDNLITKHCAFYGIKKVSINPYLTSFIGNILYDIYDPIASSIEIMRRGMVKFIKGNHFIPLFLKGVITEDLLQGNTSKMDYNKLASANSWNDAYKAVSTAKMSVRRMDKEKYPFQHFKQNNTEKSKVTTLVFL